MALDGVTVAALRAELTELIQDGHIAKIAQPERDELLFTIKNNKNQYRLLMSANASLPLVYLTNENKVAPLQAPNFCMLLRKHIGGGRIIGITQPGLERILIFHIEHRNELGDLCRKQLIVEIMGKHSNIIFCDDRETIIDSIKHISGSMSSVREVLPGRAYFIPKTQNKLDPFEVTEEAFYEEVCRKPMPIAKALYSTLTGLSPVMSEELCSRASIDGGMSAESLDAISREHLYHIFDLFRKDLKTAAFSPVLYEKNQEPAEYSAIPLQIFSGYTAVPFASVSLLLSDFYAAKERVTRIRQKSTDLRKVVTTLLERNVKKLQLQEKQYKDTEKKEKFRIYGELLTTYGYTLEPGAKELKTINYYDGKEITIPLDETLSPIDNAKRFFDRYSKLKRTAEALEQQIRETAGHVEHLESIAASLDLSVNEADLNQIRQELIDWGFVRTKGGVRKKKAEVSKPFRFRSEDGFEFYAGKNNYQNEEVSFKIASPGDWWFHAKGMPGSHVVVKGGGKELPDHIFELAGNLAAYFSAGRKAPKVEIDYTLCRNLKKPAGSKPGFVVYYTNYSLMAEPSLKGLTEVF